MDASARPGPGHDVVARVALVITAVAVGLVLLAGLRATRDEGHAVAAIKRGGPLAARVAEARRALSAAASDNPDTGPLLTLAQLELFASRPAAAVADLREVVRREPENSDGWRLLAGAARGVDPRLAEIALARLRALRPPVPAGG